MPYCTVPANGSRPYQLVCLAGTLLVLLFALARVHAYEPERLEASLLARFGTSQLRTLRRLDSTIAAASGQEDPQRLQRINDFFNNAIRFEDDLSIWGEEDYWATPLETIGMGRGDCEDIAIAKYFALKAAGVPVAKMRLVYVRATINDRGRPVQQAHMVLAYYATPDAQPLILDNLERRIRPAVERRDLQPVFSFNSEAVWSGVSANTLRDTGGGQMTRWQDLQQRSRIEGFY
jgi:predicted transglutaminase-like cysteine proteinase